MMKDILFNNSQRDSGEIPTEKLLKKDDLIYLSRNHFRE